MSAYKEYIEGIDDEGIRQEYRILSRMKWEYTEEVSEHVKECMEIIFNEIEKRTNKIIS